MKKPIFKKSTVNSFPKESPLKGNLSINVQLLCKWQSDKWNDWGRSKGVEPSGNWPALAQSPRLYVHGAFPLHSAGWLGVCDLTWVLWFGSEVSLLPFSLFQNCHWFLIISSEESWRFLFLSCYGPSRTPLEMEREWETVTSRGHRFQPSLSFSLDPSSTSLLNSLNLRVLPYAWSMV
jgi:hypothetical protein